MPADNENSSAAELVGPWVDTGFESGLIMRCKQAWNKPLGQLTNGELATFLWQRITTNYILPIATARLNSKVDDDTEIYEGELKEAIENAEKAAKKASDSG
jgi:CDI immunity proteins